MARTVKEQEYTQKRNEILEAATRLVFTKGFERMSIRDVLDELQISSGAFHHYFESREALLEAFIDRIQQESGKPLLALVQNPHLTALEKLQGFFDTLDRLRVAHRADIVQLQRVWYTDANAVVRQKVDEAVFEQRAPWITEIVSQGMREGTFTISYPQKAGEVILSLLQGMGNRHAKLFLSIKLGQDTSSIIEDFVAIHAATIEAIERVLGAPVHSLYRVDAETVQTWVKAMVGE